MNLNSHTSGSLDPHALQSIDITHDATTGATVGTSQKSRNWVVPRNKTNTVAVLEGILLAQSNTYVNSIPHYVQKNVYKYV